MAKSKRKKKRRIRFELSVSGLLGLGLVAFSIFLWMFLLGIWAGQTILLPTGSPSTISWSRVSGLLSQSRKSPPPEPAPQADEPATPAEKAMALAAEPDYEESSFFSLQVGAFSEEARADKMAASWRQRGLDAFSLLPDEGGDGLYRVCVGRFEDLADANREASRLEETENIKSFITLVPASKARQP